MRKLLALILLAVSAAAFAGPGSPYLSYGWRPASGGSTVTLDALGPGGTVAGGVTVTWTHTPVGTPTAVAVACSYYSGNNTDPNTTFTTRTYGAGTLTSYAHSVQTDGAGDYFHTVIFGLANPASGAQTVTLTNSGTIWARCNSITVTGSSTSTVFDGTTGSIVGTSGTITINVSGTTSEIAVGAAYNAGTSALANTGTNQSTLFASGAVGGDRGMQSYTSPAAATTTMSWSATTRTYWSAAAATFKAGP